MLISKTHRVPIHAIWIFTVTKKMSFSWLKVCLINSPPKSVRRNIYKMNCWENNDMLRFYSLWIHDDVFGRTIQKDASFSTPESLHETQILFSLFSPEKMSTLLAELSYETGKHFPNGIFLQSNRKKCAIRLCETILKMM